MKFKVGDKVKVIKDILEGTIMNYNCSTELYCIKFSDDVSHSYYGRELELIEEKKEMKYITLEDIRKHKPCQSAYVSLLESYGNNFKVTYEELISVFSQHKSWIEQHLSEFKEQPKYTGKFKIGDTVYTYRGIGVYGKGKITNITYYLYWQIEVTIHRKDIYNYREENVYFSLSDLKKHWHKQISDIKDDEEKRCCSNCGKDCDIKTRRDCAVVGGRLWTPKEEKSCDTCEKYNIQLASFHAIKEIEINCREAYINCKPNYKHWKPKEK